jgi:hypothetical protein
MILVLPELRVPQALLVQQAQLELVRLARQAQLVQQDQLALAEQFHTMDRSIALKHRQT